MPDNTPSTTTTINGSASPPLILPTLIVSTPVEDINYPSPRSTLASRRRSHTESAALHGGTTPPSAIEWIDTDDAPRRRKKRSRRSSSRSSESSSYSSGSVRSRRHTESGIDRFFPKLGQILESNESKSTSRPGTSSADTRKHSHEKGVARKVRRKKEDYPAGYRRTVKHRAGTVARRAEPPFKVNPSLLSVLSSLTRSTEKSSSSSATTITQLSYDRRKRGSATAAEYNRRSETESEAKRPASPTNVFGYMDPATTFDHDHDGHSTYSANSSSSSHYEPSDAGFSDISGTPSSQSTYPSPVVTRNSSFSSSTVAELRRKYDSQNVTSSTTQSPPSVSGQSPELLSRQPRRASKLRASVEDEDEVSAGTSSRGEQSREERVSPKQRSPRPAQRSDDPLRYQEDALRRHLAHVQYGQHFVDPVPGQHRSSSTSSRGSNASAGAYAPYMAMQQYQYPQPPAPMSYPMPPHAMNGHMPYPERPPAPDAPDLSQRTLAGYEQLALELARYESPVKPLYRKFEYLNHRILLHLQDELCEMEEQLRTIDEIIAQMEPMPSDGQFPPASRRGDAFNGTEMHHRRTALLGRIFMKTEQYNRAMSSFATLNRDSQAAQASEVAAYRDWLKKKSPIHELETRFLQREEDLILPGKEKPADDKNTVYRPELSTHSDDSTKHAALICSFTIAFVLPLLLFAIIPNTIGRLAATALIALGAAASLVTAPEMRNLMGPNEWAACGAAYVLLMAAVAGCIPST